MTTSSDFLRNRVLQGSMTPRVIDERGVIELVRHPKKYDRFYLRVCGLNIACVDLSGEIDTEELDLFEGVNKFVSALHSAVESETRCALLYYCPTCNYILREERIDMSHEFEIVCGSCGGSRPVFNEKTNRSGYSGLQPVRE